MPEKTPELSEILSRLERLERQNRRLKRTVLVFLAAASTIVLMGQAQTSKTVEAQRFELKDASGKTRALLETVEDNAVLALYGPQGGKQIGAPSNVFFL
jgi:hypothetical protein